jgi:pimeloyl-ACP methyl ester carboxylesterase
LTTRIRIGIVFLICALTLVGAGAAYQAIGMRADAHRFPQRGRSIQVGLLKFNLNCSGKGSPAVILDSGLGGPALDWILVQPEVAGFTRVCSWDRAGYGWSDPSPAPRTSEQIAKELKAVLDAAGEAGPFLLVGHSFGGYNVRVFTSRYPNDVTGLVLVDASHPDEGPRTDAVLSAVQLKKQKQDERRREMWDRIMDPLKLQFGLDRLSLALGLKHSPHLTRSLQEEFLYLEQLPNYQRTVGAEDRSFETSGAQAVAAGSLGDRPLIVLTAGKPYDADPLLNPAQSRRQNDIWIHELQVDEMHLSTRGTQVIVPDSGHDIPQESPGAIVAAIHNVWTAIR